jgi:hypothetical protein
LALGVFLQELAGGPLDGEKVQSRTGLADLDRAYDVGMLHTFAVARFSKEARHSSTILPQLFAQHLDRHGSVIGVLGAKNGGCSAFAHFALQGISGDCLTYEALTWHAANLTARYERGKRMGAQLCANGVNSEAPRRFPDKSPVRNAVYYLLITAPFIQRRVA